MAMVHERENGMPEAVIRWKIYLAQPRIFKGIC